MERVTSIADIVTRMQTVQRRREAAADSYSLQAVGLRNRACHAALMHRDETTAICLGLALTGYDLKVLLACYDIVVGQHGERVALLENMTRTR